MPPEKILNDDGWKFRRVPVVPLFPGAAKLLSKLVREKFPKSTVGFIEPSQDYVCIVTKAPPDAEVNTFVNSILPLKPLLRVRLSLTSSTIFHSGCLRQALSKIGEVRFLAIESDGAPRRLLFGRKATAMVVVPAMTKIPGTIAFNVGSCQYSVKIALHADQSAKPPRARTDHRDSPVASQPAERKRVDPGPSSGPAPDPTPSTAGPRGACFNILNRGTCSRANCSFSHAPASPAAAPLNGRMLRERKRAAADGFAPDGMCFAFFNSGKCKRQNCRFTHAHPIRSSESAGDDRVAERLQDETVLTNSGADVAVEAARMSAQAGQAATETKAQPACETHGASEKARANRAAAAEMKSQALCGVNTHFDTVCAWASGMAPPAATDFGSAPPTSPKAVPHADGSDDDDTALTTRHRSDDSGDDHACPHDTLEVLAVEDEQHQCVRCKKEWTPLSSSVMSCTACNGLVCDHCHRRLGQNASRRATKIAQRQARASRGGREDSPHSFRRTSSSS